MTIAPRIPSRLVARAGLVAALMAGCVLALYGCTPLASGPLKSPAVAMSSLAQKWFDRAEASLRGLDIEDAEVSIGNSLKVAPNNSSVKILAGKIALAQLRFDEAIQALENLPSREAKLLLARALWQSGQLERVTRLIEKLMVDANEDESWLRTIAELTRSGSGREPYRMTGASLAVLEMLQVPQPTLVVPVELNGEEVLAMIATGRSDVVLNSKSLPSWISLRFGRRLEVKDVPAITADLSALSKRVGAPIRMLLGTKLLRKLNATFDLHGSQFIARTAAPVAPAGIARVALSYSADGKMGIRTRLQDAPDAAWASILVDTEQLITLSMTDSGWKKADLDPKTFEDVPGQSGMKQARVPRFSLGTFDIPGVPGVYSQKTSADAQSVGFDGTMGSTLLAEFRVTMADGGRTFWLEPMPQGPAQ